MIIYIEKQAKDFALSKRILSKFKGTSIIEIDNYKNIFDKNIGFQTEKNIIISKLNWNGITESPLNYSRSKKAFFFKTSLNCPFDCQYCYLKWAFKNSFQVIFVNYDEIKESISNKINEIRDSWFDDEIIFYASDYSDTLALESITDFHKIFIPFFEQFNNVILESRTKSSNIEVFKNMKIVPKNTEIAFSLNPQELINKYEKWTSSLSSRIISINKLIDLWFKVSLRFIPLLPVNNYIQLYSSFLDDIKTSIDLEKVFTIEVWSLLYTHEDFKNIIKKVLDSDILFRLEHWDSEFIRTSLIFRKNIYWLFKQKLWKYNLCLDF